MSPRLLARPTRIEDRAGVEDAARVERRLDAAHQRELRRVLELGDVRLLLGADAVLARDRAAELHARGEHVADEVVPHVRVLLEHREVDVAVARVAAADDERAVPLRELRHRGHVLRDRRARHDHVEDVVGAGGLRGPERLLARLDELGARGRRAARTRRGHPSVPSSSASSAVSSSSRSSCRSSSTTTRYASACSLILGRRRARRRAPRAMASIVMKSMYSTRSGPMPLATIFGTAAVTSASAANGASTVAACAGRG